MTFNCSNSNRSVQFSRKSKWAIKKIVFYCNFKSFDRFQVSVAKKSLVVFLSAITFRKTSAACRIIEAYRRKPVRRMLSVNAIAAQRMLK